MQTYGYCCQRNCYTVVEEKGKERQPFKVSKILNVGVGGRGVTCLFTLMTEIRCT